MRTLSSPRSATCAVERKIEFVPAPGVTRSDTTDMHKIKIMLFRALSGLANLSKKSYPEFGSRCTHVQRTTNVMNHTILFLLW